MRALQASNRCGTSQNSAVFNVLTTSTVGVALRRRSPYRSQPPGRIHTGPGRRWRWRERRG